MKALNETLVKRAQEAITQGRKQVALKIGDTWVRPVEIVEVEGPHLVRAGVRETGTPATTWLRTYIFDPAELTAIAFN